MLFGCIKNSGWLSIYLRRNMIQGFSLEHQVMAAEKGTLPECFGVLEKVFPMGCDGLRSSPPECFACDHKTQCLRSAMHGQEGIEVRQEQVDKAFHAGLMGFWNRWSQKKHLVRTAENIKKDHGKKPGM